MQAKAKTVIRSVLIGLLIVLVVMMMVQINRLQGTARVINYAGLVRGATQREVKLEMAGRPNDDLIDYLDDILSGLKFADGHYDLVSLEDADYQAKLDAQMAYWQELKAEIQLVRQNGYEATAIVDKSEAYFALADDTVFAAERFSEKTADWIRGIEIVSIADIVLLIFMLVDQTVSAIRIAKRNKVLERQAFIDLHTGLPNKSRCEQLFSNMEFVTEPTACIMFDLNNLKKVNDTLGHSVGDQLILNFARLLRDAVPAQDFVGRYGGDEFVAVVHQADKAGVEAILANLHREIDRFNHYGKNTAISFAHGWAISTDYEHCTLRTLFDQADKYMYENKIKEKQGRRD